MILHSYVEQVMTMCRVQKWELSLYYFLSCLLFDAFMHIRNLNTLWNIIMILHSYVERVMTMYRARPRSVVGRAPDS